MSVASFEVENYRSFAERTSMILRPLTLLFGYNSSGKSALLRFLPLLAAAVEPGRTACSTSAARPQRATRPSTSSDAGSPAVGVTAFASPSRGMTTRAPCGDRDRNHGFSSLSAGRSSRPFA